MKMLLLIVLLITNVSFANAKPECTSEAIKIATDLAERRFSDEVVTMQEAYSDEETERSFIVKGETLDAYEEFPYVIYFRVSFEDIPGCVPSAVEFIEGHF